MLRFGNLNTDSPNIAENKTLSNWSIFSPRIYAGIIAVIIPLLFYIVFPNQNHSWDAVDYLLSIDSGSPGGLFHPHHLVYNAIGYFSLRILGISGISITTPHLMQIMNSIATAATLAIFYVIILKLSKKIITAVIFTLILGFSNVIWEYTVEVEVYVLGLVFLAASLLMMTKYFIEDTKPNPPAMIGLGLLGSLACLMHQMNILFAIVIFAFIILLGRDLKSRLKMATWYSAPMILVVGGTYIAVGFALGLLPNISTFANWMTNYFHYGEWGYFALNKFPVAIYGIQKVFYKASFFRDWLITGEIDSKTALFVAFFLIGAIILISLAIITLLKLRAIYHYQSKLVIVLAIWILVYAIFIFWWDPMTHELWMPILPPLIVLLMLGFEKWRAASMVKLALPIALAVFLFGVNFIDIYHNSKIENNEVYQLTAKLNQQQPSTDSIVLIYGPVPIKNYYQYFFNGKLLVTSLHQVSTSSKLSQEEALEVFQNEIESAIQNGRKVFLSQSEIDPSPQESLAILGERGSLKIADNKNFYNQYQNRLKLAFDYQWRKQTTQMYEITNSSQN